MIIDQAGFPDHGLCQVRRREHGVYEISAMYVEAKSHRVQYLKINGYTDGSAFQRSMRPTLVPTLIKVTDPRHPEYERQRGKIVTKRGENKEKSPLEHQKAKLRRQLEKHQDSERHYKKTAESQRRAPQQPTAMEVAFAEAKVQSRGD